MAVSNLFVTFGVFNVYGCNFSSCFSRANICRVL